MAKVSIVLDGEVAEKFLAIKRELGVKHNTSVMAVLITWAQERKKQ